MTEAAKPVNNDDSNHMCLRYNASSPVQHQGLLKDKWLLIKHIYFLSLLFPLCPRCQHSSTRLGPAPTWGGQVARPRGDGIGQLHTEIDYPSNLRTASVSPGRKLWHQSPPPHPSALLCPNSYPFPLCAFAPLLPPSPLSLCPCAARGTEGRH